MVLKYSYKKYNCNKIEKVYKHIIILKYIYMTSIAIIDFKNQDMGLKMVFTEADYFILEEEFDRTIINNKYNIQPIIHNYIVYCKEHKDINSKYTY